MGSTVEILKALADRNRLRIIAALQQQDELCACQITEVLQVTGATVSRHLGVLQNAGILNSRKEGRWIYYRLDPPDTVGVLLDWAGGSCATEELYRSDRKKLAEILKVGREELCRRQRGEACCPAK